MTEKTIARGGAVIALAALAVGYLTLGSATRPAESTASAPSVAAEGDGPGSLYGRVTLHDGSAYEGRMRWGKGEEAFWGHYFNGYKDENPWATRIPPERLTEARRPIELMGFEIPRGERPVDLGRPFMVRFGDIVRIDALGDGVWAFLERGIAFDPDVRVTLKSGTVVNLDRLEASDFDDGVRVWDRTRGAVDLGARQIRTIEFFSQEGPGEVPDRLYGTVRTRQGDFTGFLQWDREEALGTDALVGQAGEGTARLRFDVIRSIDRHPEGGARVTMRDGREIVLTGTRKVGHGNRGVYVDDPRYGRVLVSWGAFERVDFTPGGRSPSYDDFLPGRPLTGRVTTRTGRHLSGRLIYDLDESETTETLDAPWQGVDYTIPLGLVSSIELTGEGRACVMLQSGEELWLERAGDLGKGHAGVLVYAGGDARPEYVSWGEVARIDLDSAAMVLSASKN